MEQLERKFKMKKKKEEKKIRTRNGWQEKVWISLIEQ
jgi:hypothetical protein